MNQDNPCDCCKYLLSVTCPPLNQANGYIYYTKLPDGRFPISTRAYAVCNEGYVRNFIQTTYQDIYGTWTHPLTCQRSNDNNLL